MIITGEAAKHVAKLQELLELDGPHEDWPMDEDDQVNYFKLTQALEGDEGLFRTVSVLFHTWMCVSLLDIVDKNPARQNARMMARAIKDVSDTIYEALVGDRGGEIFELSERLKNDLIRKHKKEDGTAE